MGWKRRAGSMAFFAGVPSLDSSLNNTGSREMEAELSPESSKLAYKDMPARAGGCGGGAAMADIVCAVRPRCGEV